MAVNVIYILVGLAALFYGGNWLVQSASRLAASMGISPLVVGLTVVAFGTSIPELMVSLNAALGGSADIAIGNVVGSNIANIGLILGTAGLIVFIPIHFDLIKREIPVVIGASIAVWLMAMDGSIGQVDGIILVVALVIFNVLLIRSAQREPLSSSEKKELIIEEGTTPPINRTREIGWLVLGLLTLLIGANRLVEGSVAIARALQISELVIGITLVSVGTSLPELVTSVIAAWRRQQDILFGNVIGSNLFNLLAILGITAVVSPVAVSPSLVRVDLPIMIGFALVLVVFGLRGRLPRWGSLLLLAAYIGFIIYAVTGNAEAPVG